MDNLLSFMLLCYSIVLSSGSGLRLIGSPCTATEGGLFTLTCGNRSSGRNAMSWYINDSMVFTTNYEEGQPNDCTLSLGGQSPYRYMARRVTVSCDTHQHNVTLTINSTLDSGSVWHCMITSSNGVTRATSVKLIINVTTVRTSTYGSSTPSSTLQASISDNNKWDIHNDLYIAAAAVGGTVAATVVFVLAVMLVRRRLQRFRNGRQIEGGPEVPDCTDPRTVNIYDSPSTPEDVEHQYCQVQGGAEAPHYVNTEVVKAETDVIAEGVAGDSHYYSCVGET